MLMLAFLNSLAKGDKNIVVPLSEKATLTLPTCTLTFESKWGYDEPLENGRLVPLDYYEERDEESDKEMDEEDNEEDNGRTP